MDLHRRSPRVAVATALVLAVAVCPAAGQLVYEQVNSIGSPGVGDGEFDFAYDVEIIGQRLYIADSNNNRVQVLSLDGQYLFQFGGTGFDDGQFRRNRGIAVSPGPTAAIYCTDAKNDRVQKFDADGQHLVTTGSLGDADDQFFRPRGIAVAPDGTVVICDSDNQRMKLYEADLSLRAIFGGEGGGPGQFRSPFDVAVSTSGVIYVVDVFNTRVQMFDLQGHYVGEFGSAGQGNGQFLAPKAIAIDGDGSVFVADTGAPSINFDRIQKFDANGGYLASFGEHGDGDGQFNFITGLHFDGDGRLYVADSFNHRVTVWAPVAVPTEKSSFSAFRRQFGG